MIDAFDSIKEVVVNRLGDLAERSGFGDLTDLTERLTYMVWVETPGTGSALDLLPASPCLYLLLAIRRDSPDPDKRQPAQVIYKAMIHEWAQDPVAQTEKAWAEVMVALVRLETVLPWPMDELHAQSHCELSHPGVEPKPAVAEHKSLFGPPARDAETWMRAHQRAHEPSILTGIFRGEGGEPNHTHAGGG